MTTIEPVDPTDATAFETLYDVYRRAFDRDIDTPYSALEKRTGLLSDAYTTTVTYLARDASGRAVGGGFVQLPQADNRTLAWGEVFVAPEHRREGHGRAILDALSRSGREAGRTSLMTETCWEVDGSDAPGRSFAEACGFTLDLLDAHRVLALPATLPDLVIDPGYRLRTWVGRCPDDLVDDYAAVRRLMVQEAPSGDTPLENEHWDAERVRHEERQWIDQGRVPQVSVALGPDGDVVGHTQLLFSADSDQAYQWDTLVLPQHRGHGLGLALKVFTMQSATDLLVGRRRIHTYNAASNAHMIAVNERLGFRQVAWLGEYVRPL